MPALADRSLNELLEDVAAERPAPGGGSAAAWTCALAAGLVEMAAAFAGLARMRSRATRLRAQALEIAERDTRAYAPVLAALRLPATDPARAEQVERALSEAARPPLQLAETALRVAELAAEASQNGKPSLRGDAITAALLAEAACRAAARLVDINLADQAGDARVTAADELVRRAATARGKALA